MTGLVEPPHSQEQAHASPEWYPDPTGDNRYGYWDGLSWTEVFDPGRAEEERRSARLARNRGCLVVVVLVVLLVVIAMFLALVGLSQSLG